VPTEPHADPATRISVRKPGYYYAGRLFGLAMRLMPSRFRFGVAVRLAGVLAVPMRRTRVFSGFRALRLNSERDVSLHLLLTAMSASGTRFDLPLKVHGEEILHQALASGRGTVIVAPHALLSLLILRYLHDHRHSPTIVSVDPGITLAGTGTVAPALQPSPHLLVVLRSRLRTGQIVCAMIDRLGAKSRGKKTVEFESQVGNLRVSDSLFRLAVRCDAQVLFTSARAEPQGVRLTVAAPRPASSGVPEAIAGDFIGFVQDHALAVAGFPVGHAHPAAAPVAALRGGGDGAALAGGRVRNARRSYMEPDPPLCCGGVEDAAMNDGAGPARTMEETVGENSECGHSVYSADSV
jgi:hypothetical protein